MRAITFALIALAAVAIAMTMKGITPVALAECISSRPSISCLDPPAKIGGETDANGCLVAAGYSWCEPLGKCVRPWEEACANSSTADTQQSAAAALAPLQTMQAFINMLSDLLRRLLLPLAEPST